VDQVEIDVVELQALETRAQRPLGLLEALVVVPALGRHEDLAAVEPRGPNRLANGRLVAIRGSRVDMAVSSRQRVDDGLGGVPRRDLEDAEAKLRNRRAAAKLEVGDLLG
jgi:hypothetical protein